jgi:homoserine kinase type II
MHIALGNYRSRLSNRRGPAWWRQAARAVRPFLSLEQNELLASEIKFQAGLAKTRLPRGAIHGDLFCDNVLFDRGRVSGIIDFGFAATDALAMTSRSPSTIGAVSPRRKRRALDLPLSAPWSRRTKMRRLSAEERTLWPVCCAPRHCDSGCRASTIFICPAWELTTRTILPHGADTAHRLVRQ